MANAPIWLANSLKSNFSELPQDSVFVPVFSSWEINLKTKVHKKIQTDCKGNIFLSMVIWLYFSQLSKRDSIRSRLAAVVLLQLKFSWPFTDVISFKVFYGIQSSISFVTSIFRRNLTWPFFKFWCFFVVLVVTNFFALNTELFEE